MRNGDHLYGEFNISKILDKSYNNYLIYIHIYKECIFSNFFANSFFYAIVYEQEEKIVICNVLYKWVL